MLLIRDILISSDLIEEQFLCNLNACRGACCWEGDWGAPLETEELRTLEQIYDEIKPFLSEAGISAIGHSGLFTFFDPPGEYGTSLQPDGACVFLTYDENGRGKCGIESAHQAGASAFRKPISCHLYPVRAVKNRATGFESLNYDRWEICSAACESGKKNQLPVYRFVKDALIRKYGEDFYEALEGAANFAAKRQDHQ